MAYKTSKITWSLCAALTVLLAWSASAATIYDNSSNDLLTRLNPGTQEIGDQIILGGTSADRYITSFSFEFYGLATGAAFAGANVEARVRFYENNGPAFNGYATPNNSFYDSGWFSVGGPTARDTFNFTSGSDFPTTGLFVPVNEMTWSVQFQGMGAGDQLGVSIYSPSTVGLTYPDYWQNNAGSWTLLTNSLPMNFAARIEAVPEPSSVALLVLGGLGLFGARLRLRRRS